MSKIFVTLKDCIVLGAAGFPFSPGNKTSILFDNDIVTFSSAIHQVQLSLLELAEISVNGPGTVVTGGGFIGGGFGIEEALGGMAIAGILNAITTKKTTHTFLSLTTNFGEIHLHYGSMEPAALRIVLCSVFSRLRQLNKSWRESRLQLIEDQLTHGSITPAEADFLKLRLDTPPSWPRITDEQTTIDDLVLEDETRPLGMCPNCDKKILLSSEKCRHCGANFGQYSSWSVIPLGS